MHLVSGFNWSSISLLQKEVASFLHKVNVSDGQSVSQQHEISQLFCVMSQVQSATSSSSSIVFVDNVELT